ncbi:MAG TPA: Uma2 family endonuclease [Nostocaceae cyanobacterium]|nr:Uma2 family endonuclease [Nostocaceae cyanobacterium]
MSQAQTQLPTDTWIYASWEEYEKIIAELLDKKAKSYYYKGYMRLEMSPVSFDHGQDHIVIIAAIVLFTALKGVPARGLDTTTFRKTGKKDCQPDIAYYFGERANIIPSGTGIVDLNIYPAPDLVIEIAKSSLLDDLGTKRSLYEDLNVREYWVVDVQNTQIIAYSIADQGSKRIQVSQVLPGLAIATLEQALQQSREVNQAQVTKWLLTQFQQ